MISKRCNPFAEDLIVEIAQLFEAVINLILLPFGYCISFVLDIILYLTKKRTNRMRKL